MSGPAHAADYPTERSKSVARAADVQDAGVDTNDDDLQAVAVSEVGPGARLATARETLGMSLGDVARQLKLAVKQIEALERDDYDAFPSPVFVRGFLRNYARLLQLDLEHQISQVGVAHVPDVQEELPAVATRGSRRVLWGRWTLAVVLAILVAIALFRPGPDGEVGGENAPAGEAEALRFSAPPADASGSDPDPRSAETVRMDAGSTSFVPASEALSFAPQPGAAPVPSE